MRMLWLVLALPACTFTPDLGDGTLLCGADRSCPPEYVCAADDRCHRAGDGGVADLDAPPDLRSACATNGDKPGPRCGGGN